LRSQYIIIYVIIINRKICIFYYFRLNAIRSLWMAELGMSNYTYRSYWSSIYQLINWLNVLPSQLISLIIKLALDC